MFRIDNTSSVTTPPPVPPAGAPGFFTNGNPTSGLQATIVDDWWANMVQEEILAVVNAAAITPSKTNNAQLLAALNHLYLPVGALSGYLPLAGGTMTGFPLLLARDPVQPMEAAIRQFVLAQIGGITPTGFLPLTGGTLANPGNNNLLSIEVSAAHDNFITFTIDATRSWLIGVEGQSAPYNGHFWLYDSSAGRICIDVGTALGRVDIASGRLSVTGNNSPGIAFFNAGGGGPYVIHNSGNVLNVTVSDANGQPAGNSLFWIDSSGNSGLQGRLTVGDFQSYGNVNVPTGFGNFGSYVQVGTNLYVSNGRAAILELDCGVSQSNRQGWIDGQTGNAQFNGSLYIGADIHIATHRYLYADYMAPAAALNVNIVNGLVVFPASGQLDALWIHAGCELLTGDLRVVNSAGGSGGTGWFNMVRVIGGGAGIYMDGTTMRPTDNQSSCGITGQAWSQVASYWFNTTSDARLKHHLQRPPDGALAAVEALSPVQFHWAATEPDEGAPLHRGFLAQDVRQVLGERFAGWHEENDVQSLAYNELIAVLWQAVQELAAKVEALEERIH